MNTFDKIYHALIIGLLLINLSFISSCSNAGTPNTNNANKAANNAANANKNVVDTSVKDDVTELLDIIRLPELPEEAMWKEESIGKGNNHAPGQTDKKLT